MHISTLATIFLSIFIAELGDKTQLATMLFSADSGHGRMAVFLAASAALVCSTLVAVLLGGSISRLASRRLLTVIAGTGFILIGAWTLVQGIRTPA